MSIQINYFGGGEALGLILDRLAELIDTPVIIPERSSTKEIKPIDIGAVISLAEDPHSFAALIPAQRFQDLVLRPTSQHDYRVDFQNSPAIELSPGRISLEKSCAFEGR